MEQPEERNIRINKVLGEFNISLDRAIDFLKENGIAIAANPNTKISQSEYEILRKEFGIVSKPKEILEIEKFYNIELSEIIEDENEYSKVEFYKNENKYCLNSKREVIKLNLKNNVLESLSGLKLLSKTITHLNLAATRLKSIEELSDFHNLIFLDLSTNQISKIESISNLKKIELIYLDNNEIVNIPKLNLPRIIEICLYSNQITEIKNLNSLKNLASLDISNNKINNISAIKELINLKQINLRNNEIIDISFLEFFEELDNLDLSCNKIIDIIPLKNLSIKKELKIGENKIFDLTPLYYSLKKGKINFLNAFGNPLIYPSFEVVQRGERVIVKWFDMIIQTAKEKILLNEKLKEPKLDIGNMGLTDLGLIPELFELEHITELIISNEWAEYDEQNNRWVLTESKNNILPNNIINIPNDISKLINLERLLLGGNWKSKKKENYIKWRIKDISNLVFLKKMHFLNISNNEIENISDVINFNNIEIIHLNNNEIIEVPNLKSIKSLKEVYLSNNIINNIDFLKDCIQIETIDLHSNKISDLIPLADLLKISDIQIKNSSWEKKCISISKNNQNINPPYEVLNQTKKDFLLYIKLLEYESKLNLEPYYNMEIKVVLVGNSYSGKSTFLNYLKTKKFKKGLPSTHWLVTEELENIKIKNEDFKLRFFDFGGQDYYHDTHKIFFSSDSIYLLLWDKQSNILGKINTDRNNSNEEIQVFPLEYWLDSINIFAKKFLSESQKQMEQLLDERDRKINQKVRDSKKGNWVNEVSESIDLTSRVSNNKNILVIQNKIDIEKEFLNQTLLLTNYSTIYDFVSISLSKGKGVKQFFELYNDIIVKNLNYKRPLLATWGYIKDNLKDVFKNDDFIIEIDVFKKRINDFLAIWLEKELKLAQNQITTILFNDDEIELFANFLKEIGLVIFDSENDILKSTIIVHQNKFLEEVSKILNIAKENEGRIATNNLESINHFKKNIQILISHNIIFKHINEENYIAPLFLPEEPNFLINLLVDIKIPFRRFKFNGFIPKSIILSVFSKIVNKDGVSENDFYYWKNGLIFKDKILNQKILLRFDIGSKFGFAFIDVFNFDNNNNDRFITEIVEILKTIINNDGIKVDELITIDGQYFVEREKLITNYKNKINLIKAENFNINSFKHNSIFKYNKFMEEELKSPNKKLFISYSKQDEVLVNNFIEHLSSLQSTGVIDSWYCTELKAGEDWDAKIKEKLDEADIVCFMISPKFMSTPYIHKYEVKHIFKRYHRGDNVKIVPIIMDFIDWSRTYTFQSELGEEITWTLDKFTALPFAGNEIKKFKSENMAWYIVEQALKVIVEDNIDSEKDEDEIVRKFSPKVKKIYEDIINGNI